MSHISFPIQVTSHIPMIDVHESVLYNYIYSITFNFSPADETVYFSHENLRVPSSKKEIADIVMSAALHGQKIRVIGSGHSWSGIAKPQDILVSLHKLKGLVRIDKEKYQVSNISSLYYASGSEPQLSICAWWLDTNTMCLWLRQGDCQGGYNTEGVKPSTGTAGASHE